MSPRSKKEYVEAVVPRYKKASRPQKKVIVDEFCRTLGYHRKHAIRVLRIFKRFSAPRTKQRGRRPCYHREEILKPLKRIWLAANLPCSKRLKAILSIVAAEMVRNALMTLGARGVSGKFEGMSMISRRGSRNVRKVIYTATFCAVRYASPFRDYSFFEGSGRGYPSAKAHVLLHIN